MKKNQVIWRRSISVFLALLLCLTLLPVAALAANTPPRITAIGGDENQSISADKNGPGWSYDADSATLTLTNYTYSGEGAICDDSMYACIVYKRIH